VAASVESLLSHRSAGTRRRRELAVTYSARSEVFVIAARWVIERRR